MDNNRKKSKGLTWKLLLICTLLAAADTAAHLWINHSTGISWMSPNQLESYLAWPVLAIAWAVFFWNLYRKKKKDHQPKG